MGARSGGRAQRRRRLGLGSARRQAVGSEEGGFHCQGSPRRISISVFSLFWGWVAPELPVSLSHASGALVLTADILWGRSCLSVPRMSEERVQLWLCELQPGCPAHTDVEAAETSRQRSGLQIWDPGCPRTVLLCDLAGEAGRGSPFPSLYLSLPSCTQKGRINDV